MKAFNTRLHRRKLPNIVAFRHWCLRNRDRTANNAAQTRENDPITPIGSWSMSQSVHVHAFRDLLDDRGVVDDPGRIAAYTTDQRQLFTGSTFAVLKPATTKQVADI